MSKERKAWLKRAITIQKKQYLLFCDMMDALGEDHPATDFADNGNVSADELVEVLSKDTLNMWNNIGRF